MRKSLIFTKISNIANQIAVKKSFRKQWPNGLYGIVRTLNFASQPVKKSRVFVSIFRLAKLRKRFLVQLVQTLVTRLLEVRNRFSVVFLKLKSRVFVKICFHFFVHKLSLGKICH